MLYDSKRMLRKDSKTTFRLPSLVFIMQVICRNGFEWYKRMGKERESIDYNAFAR
ncbi:hypothetical protein LEP1GSC047_4392 [Leptospira inadai serovar Lyme str. 10]|uniref:Uncharacterized protein n=1 Tax=Leptospira inadai serovar Lyme str. 10 TaxID=1049790 RepID=V6HET3_9LEPT|nr:hypothetical protein LEP1GSC047_4392 [Leptospira inadai serovar Lyme str. 10]